MKLVIKIAKTTIVLAACLISIFSYALQSTPNIVNNYPQCDYMVIDTVMVKQRIDAREYALHKNQYQKAFKKIVKKLHRLASSVNADEIVLVEKNFLETSKQNYLAFSAELIKTCAEDASFPKTPAKLNKQGMAQFVTAGTTLEINNKVVINLPTAKKRREPALVNANVNIDGAYGVKLGDSITNVIEVLGTPTVEIKLNEDLQMLMYGRLHIFEFSNTRLRGITGHNPHFSSDLKNLLAFDDRLDDVTWQINGNYSKNKYLSKIQTNQVVSDNIVIKNNKAQLQVLVEKRLRTDNLESPYVVDSFRLSIGPDTFLDDVPPSSSIPILTFISERLIAKSPSFLISSIPYAPTMTAWLGPSKRLYTFGQHVAIEAVGDRVTTVHVFENLYNEGSPFYKKEVWQVGAFKQGMNAESAQLAAGEKGDYFNEKLEITQATMTQTFYFYEKKDQVKLYGSEINFY